MTDEGPAPDARVGIELFAEVRWTRSQTTTTSTRPRVVGIRLLGGAGARPG